MTTAMMMVDNFECAGYTFYSKFDSGNLGKVELVRCCEGNHCVQVFSFYFILVFHFQV